MTAEQTSSYIEALYKDDYTAFEVFPTTINIPAGTYDCNMYELEELPEANKDNYEKYYNSVLKVDDKKYTIVANGSSYSIAETNNNTIAELFGHNFDVVTGLPYTIEVNSAKIAGFTTKTYVDKEDSDIVIDWGDGSKTAIKDLEVGETVNRTTLVGYEDVETQDVHDDRKVQIKHEYNDDKCNQRYIVKIYGKNYTTLRTYCSGATNICSRIFEYDLPISNCVMALSSACYNNDRLLRLNITEYHDFKSAMNFANAFTSGDRKSNLRIINVSDRSSIYFKNIDSFSAMFRYCESLVSSNFHLSQNCVHSSYGYTAIYEGCKNLSSNIKDLLPIQSGFSQRVVNLYLAFSGCSKLTGSLTEEFTLASYSKPIKLSDILWDDTSKLFIHKDGPFSGCKSLTDYDSIPEGWK